MAHNSTGFYTRKDAVLGSVCKKEIMKKEKKKKCNIFRPHDWEYMGECYPTYQRKKCKKCGKLKTVDI